MIPLWRAWRGGEFGPGLMPFSGGTAEQPACVMAAFAVMEEAAQALKPGKTE